MIEVRRWILSHNHRVKERWQGVRLGPCLLPSKSPWLNPIEPKWVHGKRAVVEPERLLSATELEARVYTHYACEPKPHLIYALHDALVKPMPGNVMAPSLAESWTESPDGLVYEFQLRQGVRFHN